MLKHIISKIKIHFKNNKNIHRALLVIGISVVLIYGLYTLNALNSLSQLTKNNAAEISFLKQSIIIFKNNAAKDHQSLLDQNKRIDRIMVGNEQPEPQYFAMPTMPPSSTAVRTTTSGSTTPSTQKDQNTLIGEAETTIIGTVEIYDPVSKEITVYKEPTTVSEHAVIKNGITVPYYKKVTDWYLIQTQADPPEQWWVHTRNVRSML